MSIGGWIENLAK